MKNSGFVYLFSPLTMFYIFNEMIGWKIEYSSHISDVPTKFLFAGINSEFKEFVREYL